MDLDKKRKNSDWTVFYGLDFWFGFPMDLGLLVFARTCDARFQRNWIGWFSTVWTLDRFFRTWNYIGFLDLDFGSVFSELDATIRVNRYNQDYMGSGLF